MTVAPQADTEVVTGFVQGILDKGQGKFQIEVNVGRDQPRRLWTKDTEIVQQMMGMIGQQLSFMCGISEWNRSDGTPVRSLWINGFGQPGAMPQQPLQQQPYAPQAPLPPQQPMQQVPQQAWQPAVQEMQQAVQQAAQQGIVQPQAPNAYEKDQRIMREAASKVAVQLLKHLKVEDQTFDNLIKLSERLVAYYEHGVQWGGGGSQGNPSATAVTDGDPGPQGAPHTDDDIPF